MHLRSVALTIAAVLAVGGCERRPEQPRNVVVLLVDTLRADHLSLYGYRRPTSPALDRLAAEATVFDRARAQATCTFPSVNSILTSRYPSAFLGQPGSAIGIPADIPTLAQMLRARGFRTGAVSASSVVRATRSRRNPTGGYGAGFEVFDESCEGRAAGCVTRRGRELAARFGEPFFLYLHFMEPHAPYEPPRPYRRQFAAARLPAPRFVRRGDPTPIQRMLYSDGPKVTLDSGSVGHLVDLYDDEVRYWDEEAAVFVDGLRRHGLLDRTLLVVLADHGEDLLDHGHWGHCRSLFTSTTWTPLLLRGPAVARGRRVRAVVQNLDVVPTVLDLLRLPAPAGLEGRSLRPLLAGEGEVSPAAATPGGRRRFAFSSIGTLRSVDDGSFTLITDLRSNEVRLFGAADPAQQTDLAAARPQEAARLRTILDVWMRRVEGERKASATAGEESLQRLRALGYLE
ncbi:MAG TPA: sulfatase [Thermoanaerobaculia bacterium]|nr:sulfatase [Thermoanaerobaculia bacterium]